MLVTIDVDKMWKLGLDPNEYTLLSLIQNHATVTAQKLFDSTPGLTSSTLDKFVKKRLIHNSNIDYETNMSRIMLRERFVGELKKNDQFDELLQLYPAFATRPDGTRDYLKTDLNRSRKLYLSMIKSDAALHNTIMDCLKLELRERNRTNKSGYMKRLYSWLNTEEWLAWKERLPELEVGTIDLGYGIKLE